MTRMTSYDPDAPIIVVHCQAHAEAALAAAAASKTPVVLASPPMASTTMGAGYFRAMIDAARQAHPTARSLAVLDCGDRAGDALGALREGLEAVCFRGNRAVFDKLSDIAAQVGAIVLEDLPVALDLATAKDPATALLKLHSP